MAGNKLRPYGIDESIVGEASLAAVLQISDFVTKYCRIGDHLAMKHTLTPINVAAEIHQIIHEYAFEILFEAGKNEVIAQSAASQSEPVEQTVLLQLQRKHLCELRQVADR